jgi:hypothetical protein
MSLPWGEAATLARRTSASPEIGAFPIGVAAHFLVVIAGPPLVASPRLYETGAV